MYVLDMLMITEIPPCIIFMLPHFTVPKVKCGFPWHKLFSLKMCFLSLHQSLLDVWHVFILITVLQLSLICCSHVLAWLLAFLDTSYETCLLPSLEIGYYIKHCAWPVNCSMLWHFCINVDLWTLIQLWP